jgi:hypothetical protein
MFVIRLVAMLRSTSLCVQLGRSVLYGACEDGQASVIEKLILSGADVTSGDQVLPTQQITSSRSFHLTFICNPAKSHPATCRQLQWTYSGN